MTTEQDRFAAFADTFAVLEIVGLVFLVAVLAESAWDIVTRRRAKGETFANFAIALGNHLLDRTIFGSVFVIGLFVAEAFVSWRLPVTGWSFLLALIGADFTYYWMHRWEHEIRILWAYHGVHHSSPEFNLSTSFRLAWIEGLIEWIFFLPMILLGFDAAQTIVALLVVVLYQTWIHTERVGKLGPLDRIFNTPSVHRVHHGSNPKYIDRNYGGILIVWDRLFGTYQSEEKPVTFGITTPVGSVNPIAINVQEFRRIIIDVTRSGRLSHALRYIFGKPGWRPSSPEGNGARR